VKWESWYFSGASVTWIKSIQVLRRSEISSLSKGGILTIMEYYSIQIRRVHYPIKLSKMWVSAAKSIMIHNSGTNSLTEDLNIVKCASATSEAQ
jgi:hypothetical protein